MTVDLPPPERPTRAIVLPASATKFTECRTRSSGR